MYGWIKSEGWSGLSHVTTVIIYLIQTNLSHELRKAEHVIFLVRRIWEREYLIFQIYSLSDMIDRGLMRSICISLSLSALSSFRPLFLNPERSSPCQIIVIHRSPWVNKWTRIIMRQIPLTENLKETKDLMWFEVVLLFLEGRDRKRTNQIEGFVTLPSWEKW